MDDEEAQEGGGNINKWIVSKVFSKNEKIPGGEWAPIFSQLKTYMQYLPAKHTLVDGDFTMDLSQKSAFFSEKVFNMMFPDKERYYEYHNMLADFFQQKAKAEGNVLYWRGFREYPYHLIKSLRWKDLELLFTLERIEHACSIKQSYLLLNHYSAIAEAIRTSDSFNKTLANNSRDFLAFFQKNIIVLDQHPSMVWQFGYDLQDESSEIRKQAVTGLKSKRDLVYYDYLNKKRKERPTNEIITDCKYSSDGKRVACSQSDGCVQVWDSKNMTRLFTLKYAKLIKSICWIPAFNDQFKDPLLACGASDYKIIIYNTKSKKEFQTLAGHTAVVNGLDYNEKTRMLASASGDGTIRMYDVEALTWQSAIKHAHKESARCIRMMKDGKTVVTCGYTTELRVFDLDGKELNKFDIEAPKSLSRQASLEYDYVIRDLQTSKDDTLVGIAHQNYIQIFTSDLKSVKHELFYESTVHTFLLVGEKAHGVFVNLGHKIILQDLGTGEKTLYITPYQIKCMDFNYASQTLCVADSSGLLHFLKVCNDKL